MPGGAHGRGPAPPRPRPPGTSAALAVPPLPPPPRRARPTVGSSSTRWDATSFMVAGAGGGRPPARAARVVTGKAGAAQADASRGRHHLPARRLARPQLLLLLSPRHAGLHPRPRGQGRPVVAGQPRRCARQPHGATRGVKGRRWGWLGWRKGWMEGWGIGRGPRGGGGHATARPDAQRPPAQPSAARPSPSKAPPILSLSFSTWT